MAMNRTEIELLIKARNDAQGAFDQLNKQVKSVTGEADKATEGMDKLGKKTKDGGVAAGAAGVAFGLLAERVGRGLVTAFGDTIREANALDRGLIGLGATAKAFGTDAGAAQAAAKSLAADGLMNVGEAASGLKNLLAGGFNLPQAIELMNRFKDSAAFGRQGSLEFGQAIVGATEGIKNGNSALVDNAGLTKNLSNILVEAGFSAQDLSKVQSDLNVRTALYNGILKETNPQLGQTALFLDTAQGKQAQFNSQVTIAQQKIGAGLQPVLGQMLTTLAPMVKFIGDNAGAFISLGAAVGAVVAPLAAMKAMAALGIPTLGQMAGKALSLGTDLATATKEAGSFRGGLEKLAGASDFTFKGMGILKTGVLAVGAAFIGWEVGTAIAKLTGLDKAIERTVDRMSGLSAATAGAQQDVINRAQGADWWIKYTDAITFNQNALVAHTKVADDNTVALRKQLDAKLAMGEIDRAAYDDAIILLNMREREITQANNLTKLRENQAAAAKKFRDEIASTGQTVEQLQASMKKDEDTFKAWAEAVGLSDSTVKQLKDSLTATEKQHEKNAAAAKKAADAQKELLKQLEDQAGILTQGGLNARLEEYQTLLTLAATQGTPALATAVKALWPEFEKLAAQAKASGLAVSNIDGVMRQAAEGAGLVLTNVRQFNTIVPLVAGVTEANRVNTASVRDQITAQDTLTAAYKQFGITAPAELAKVAQDSRTYYEVLRSSGTATSAQLKAAWRQMVDDQKQASGELPSYWEKNVYPGIKRSVETIQTAVQGSFAQMLLGAKSFGEGFTDIWKSLKAGVLQILAEMLNTFINSFLKGILGALSGQQGAMSQAFGGLFSGGGGGIGSLFGGAGLTGIGGAPIVTGAAGLGAAPGAGAVGGGGLFGGLGAAGIAGGAGAGAAGIGLGMLGKNIFGGAGLAAGGFGAGTGFATGAMIGSVVPGIGTIVGGVIGGLSGLISGLWGKSESQKVGEARNQFTANFGGEGTGAGSGFANLAAELAKLGEAAGGGEGGGSLFRNLFAADTAKEYEAAIRAIQVAMENAATAAATVTDATGGITDAALDAAAAEDDLANAKASNSEADLAAKEAQLQALQAQGLEYTKHLVQLQEQGEAGPEALRKVEAAIQDVEVALMESRREAARVEDEIKMLGRTTEGVSRTMDRSLNTVGFGDMANDAEAAAREIDAAFRDLRFTIPVDYDVAAPPGEGGSGDAGAGGGDELPQAAKGVMANRASLVIFGEGGEPEVGGPRSFFKDVFRQLGKEGAGAGGGDVFAPVFNISTLTPGDTATVIEKVVMPKLLELWRQNRGGSLTNAKSILGV